MKEKKIIQIKNFDFEQVVASALCCAYEAHESLGALGEKLMEKNQFGETALRLDIEAERAVLNSLREINFPARVISEEHGIVEIVKEPKYLGILDGLDGSDVYRKERGSGMYGTMFGIFSNLNPRYKEYLTSGIMLHATNQLFIANKGAGAFVISENRRKPTHTSRESKLNKKMVINIDEHYDFNKKFFSKRLSGFNIKDPRAMAAYFTNLVSKKSDLVLICSRKNNLEPAIAYGLVKEAGGVMVSKDGASLGENRYLEFGKNEELPIIAASSEKLVLELLDFLNKKEISF